MNSRVWYISRTLQFNKFLVTTPARAGTPGRPKDIEKRAALVEAAGQLFCRHGFDAVSLDAVARAASVSKLTIYSHFGDKEGLFTAAVEARCEQQLPHGLFERPEGLSLRDALVAIGRAFTGLVHSEDAIQLMRMMVAQPGGSTRLATLYFAAGPKRALDEMEGFLRGVQASGQLAIGDPREAAGHFFMLLKGIVHMQVLIGLAPPPDAEARARHVERCVDFFLRAHARGP